MAGGNKRKKKFSGRLAFRCSFVKSSIDKEIASV